MHFRSWMYEADMLARQSQTPLYLAAICALTSALVLGATASAAAEEPIIHDAEYSIIEAQHGQQWAKEDVEIDAKLAEIRERNDGKPPNILYILLDDLVYG